MLKSSSCSPVTTRHKYNADGQVKGITVCAAPSTNPARYSLKGLKQPRRLCNRTFGHPLPHRHYDPKTFQVVEEWK